MLQQEEYTKLSKENITETYKKSTRKNYSTLTTLQKRSQKNCQSLIGLTKCRRQKHAQLSKITKISQTKFSVA